MNIQQLLKSALPHLAALIVFAAVTLIYFWPAVEGKVMSQSDMMQWKGTSEETRKFREKTGEEALWTNSQFGGMPAYQIDMKTKGNLINKVRVALLSAFPKPANIIFWTMAGFYLLLIVLGASPWVAAAGALAYSFATYNFLIIDAGHTTKAMSISTVAPVIAGVLLAYKGRYWSGAALAGFALACNVVSNHYQITYYLFILLLVFFIAKLIDALQNNTIANFVKASALLAIAFVLAIGTDATRLWTTYEYSKESMRGGSAMTDGSTGSGGLDKDYALAWSYGKLETFTLLVPRFMGGGSGEPLSNKDSRLYEYMKQAGAGSQAPTYWGAQPFTGGTIYAGTIVCFLFLLGCLVVRGYLKWWLLAATILSIILSWGKNFAPTTDLFFAAFPMYNKFRVVSMILVIAQITMPLLGFWGLHRLLTADEKERPGLLTKLYLALGITGGLLLFLAVIGPNVFSFEGQGDSRYPKEFITMLVDERISMLQGDALRALLLVAVTGGLLWAWLTGKLKNQALIVGIIGLLTLGDLWVVNKRYLNDSNFMSSRKADAIFEQSPADAEILKDPDPNFRVFNVTRNPFNDGITSYWHKSVGGYHGAKLSRYQDLIENQLQKNNQEVLNMLNTKYIIAQSAENMPPMAQRNPNALGNAWFVRQIKPASTAQEEMAALSDFDARTTAIVNTKEYAGYLNNWQPASADTAATIRLTDYKPNHLTYEATAAADGLAVFSEIYYNDHKGWNAYLDGKPVPHIRADYLLRGMKIPAGQHKVEFKFEPKAYFTGEKISIISSGLLLLFCLAAIGFSVRAKKNENENEGLEIASS